MERWAGRVALVTGASVGIGAAICKALVKHGVKVVGTARAVEKIESLSAELKGQPGSLRALKCDITKDDEVYALFKTIKQELGGVDICINNAGMSFNNSLLDGNPEEWRYMMSLNVVALCLCTKLAVASMRERKVDDGHIINISSYAGHRVGDDSKLHFYASTKFALRAISDGLRQELRELKSHIRVSSISPGYVQSEFAARMAKDEGAAATLYSSIHCIQTEDIASTTLHLLSCPPNVEINDVVMRPVDQLC